MTCTKALSAPLGQASRRIVTVIFTDLVGSTALGERLDPETLRELLDRYFDAMRVCLEHHGGTIEKYIGDAIMAVFGIPRAREDDALRAIRAAHEMSRALEALNEDLASGWGVTLANRTGVYTGEIVAGDPATGQRLVTGDAVNTAARLEQAASSNEILVGESTYRLVRHAGTFEATAPVKAKGKAEPVRAYRLVSIQEAPSIPRRLSAIVGRSSELEELDAALATSLRQQECAFALVSGDPGVGKTRLVAELVGRWGERARVIQARCPSYGEDIPFWAIADLIKNASGIVDGESTEEAISRLDALCAGVSHAEAVSARLASTMDLAPQAFDTEEIFWAFRQLIEHLASVRPLLLVVDDLQWANALLLEAISHVVSLFSAGAGALILCTARPEFAETQMDWVANVESAFVLELAPLSAIDTEQLVADLLGHGQLPPEVMTQLEQKSQGNPLFVEQIIAMWRDDGILAGDGASISLSGSSNALTIPSSIRALLMARLDGLAQSERGVLERGSIVGEAFHENAIRALGQEPGDIQVDGSLTILQTKRFIRPNSLLLDNDTWAFMHVLVRDAAYDGMLKRTRSRLHVRLADWLEQQAGDRPGEHEEIIAFHVEQAFRLGSELGSEDMATEQIGQRAASLLERCANRARDRMLDLTTSSLFERAAQCVPRQPTERQRLLSLAAEAAWHASDLNRLAALLSSMATDESDMDGPTRMRMHLAQLANPESVGSNEERLAKTDRIIDEARRRNDVEGLAWALRLRAQYAGWLGHMGVARRASREGVDAARSAGRRDLEIDSLAALAMDAIFDDSSIGETVEACLEALARHEDDISLEMALSRPLAVLTAMQGKVLDARRYLSRYRQLVQQFGETPHRKIMLCEIGGMVATIEGDPMRLEREVRPAYELLSDMQDTTLRCSYSAWLAHACASLGRFTEAITLSEESEHLSSADDYDAQSRWRSARGLAFAGQGRYAAAIALAKEALAVASSTDDLTLQGDALLDIAQISLQSGQMGEARLNLDEAIRRFERKGNVASAARAMAMMPKE